MNSIKILVAIFLITIATGFGFNDKIENSNNDQESRGERQLGIYFGYVFGQKINNAHGVHGSFFGQQFETSVEGIVIEQNWTIGINARYFITDYFGFLFDAQYSQAKFPEQQVTLNGFSLNQPKSDLDFYTISIGPIVRYKDAGIWQSLNPYVSVALSIPFGSASDVDLSPVYGQGGSSSLNGIGFNLQFGAQYQFNHFAVSLEYRFEYLDLNVDHFRSFTEGLRFNKSGSYILIGGYYSF